MELSYDRVKFIASVLAAHSRSDLARHVHVAMYSCGIRVALGILSKKQVGTQSASLDGSRAVKNALKLAKVSSLTTVGS